MGADTPWRGRAAAAAGHPRPGDGNLGDDVLGELHVGAHEVSEESLPWPPTLPPGWHGRRLRVDVFRGGRQAERGLRRRLSAPLPLPPDGGPRAAGEGHPRILLQEPTGVGHRRAGLLQPVHRPGALVRHLGHREHRLRHQADQHEDHALQRGGCAEFAGVQASVPDAGKYRADGGAVGRSAAARQGRWPRDLRLCGGGARGVEQAVAASPSAASGHRHILLHLGHHRGPEGRAADASELDL
mmetsp:Transcript_98100/g.256161  ORF Transcript_98100/g.256161 Transcript_98100/m.256161 type:complete len:242 (-) Transcript_98100:1331-2056(-)